MTTKLDRMVTYFERFLLIKSHDLIITWSCKITWQTKIIIFPLPRCLWLPNLAVADIEWGVLFHKITRTFDYMVLQGQVKCLSCYITNTTRPMANKPGKMVTYSKQLQLIKSNSHTHIMWGHVKSRDKSKTFKSKTSPLL